MAPRPTGLVSTISSVSLAGSTFLGSAEIPSAEKMNPKNSMMDLSNSLFLRLSVRPLSLSQSLEHRSEGVIVFSLCLAVDNDVVTGF